MKLGVFLMWSLMGLHSAHSKTSNLSSERVKTRWPLPKNENALTSDGSGLGEEDGDDGCNDYESSAEGSGELPSKKIIVNEKSSCLKLLETASFHKMVGAFVPRCSFDGTFEPLQCHGVTGECWCSDKEGRKIPGTIRKEPDMPKCDNFAKGKVNEDSKKSRGNHKSHSRTTKVNKIFFEVQTNSELPRRVTAGTSRENIVVDNIAVNENSEVLVPYKTLNNAGGETRKYSRKNKDSSGVMPYNEHENESYGKYQMSASRAALMMTQPGVLAGIVCAGVVLVLCFVTFVTFIAYRLRRRSYYQAEQKSKSPPLAGGYVAGSGYGEIYGDGFRYSPAKYQTPTKIPPWSGIDTNGSLSYSMRHDRELYG